MAPSRKLPISLLVVSVLVLLASAVGLLLLTRVPAQAAADPRTMVTRTITVPAAAFAPATDNFDYSNYGHRLVSNSGSARFSAPLYFEAPTVIVRRLTLYAYDNSMAGDLCVTLYRTIPSIGSETSMGEVCSTDAFLDDPRVFVQRTLDYRTITGAYGPYLYLNIPGPLSGAVGYAFYDVKVTYSYQAGA